MMRRKLLTKEEATLYLTGHETSGIHTAFDVCWSPYKSLRAEGAIDVTCRAGCVHTVHHDEVREWFKNPPPSRRARLHGVPTQIQVLRSQLTEFARRLAAEQWHGYGYYSDDTNARQCAEEAADKARAETKADIGRALLEALGEEQS